MRFDQSFLDEIRARLPVSQVVARRVKLKRRGREFVGLSPFKQEKTPSFTVNDQKGFYHCFSSGEHGDIFKFLQTVEGLSFPEAVERLAADAGVPMPKASPQEETQSRHRDRLRDACEAAAVFFVAELKGARGGPARRYLDERGVSEALVNQFRIGFAPNERFTLKEHLAAKGFSQEEMTQAGLLIAGEDIAVSFDRFRNRIVFPIGDLRGRAIAFGARALDPSQTPKYLNSPETPIFHKGAVLFNVATARQAAHKSGKVIVVEGYMDVIALAGAGFANAVAPLGTALTEDQLTLLWRMSEQPLLCFDGDDAGQAAAFRVIETALPKLAPGSSLAFAFLPGGQDPDDLLRNDGTQALQNVLDRARPMADVLWMRETQGGQFDTPERRAALEERLEALLGRIGHPKLRRHYERDLGARLERLWSQAVTPIQPASMRGGPVSRLPRDSWKRGGQRQPGKWQRGVPKIARAEPASAGPPSESLRRSRLVGASGTQAVSPREAVLLVTVLAHPWLLDAHSEDLARLSLKGTAAKRLREGILAAHAEQGTLDSQGLRTQLSRSSLDECVAQVARAITHKSDWFTEPDASREDVATGWGQVLALHRRSWELERELEVAERAFQNEGTDEAFERLCAIRKQLLDADGMEASVEGYGVTSGRETQQNRRRVI